MKKALVLMLAVLLLGTVGMARTDIFDDIVVEGTATIQTLSVSALVGAILAHEYGGLEADVSAYDGLVKITGGATSAVTVTSLAESILDDAAWATFYATTSLQTGSDIQVWDADLDTFAALTPTANAQTLLESTNFLSMTQDLSVEIGVDVQAQDDELNGLAGLTFADDQFILGTGAGTIGMASCTVFAQGILDDADLTAFYATTRLQTGSTILTYDVGLANLAGISMAADKFYYTSADNTHVAATVTSFARTILDDINIAAFYATTGLQTGSDILTYDAGLSNLAGVAMTADQFYYTSGDNTHVAADVTTFARSFLDDTTEGAFRATVNLEPGIDVQTYSSVLVTYAGINPSSDIQSFLDAADDSTARGNLGVAISSDVQAWDAQLDDIAGLVQSDSYIIVGDDTNWVAETGATARSSLGLAIDSDVQAHSADLDTIATAATTATNEGVVFVGQFAITYTQTSSYTVCTIPANADVTKIEVLTKTAFTGGTGTTIDIGWSGNLDSYTDDLAIQTAGYTVADGYSAMGDVTGSNRDVLAQIATDDTGGACVVLVYWTMGTPGTP